MIDVHQFRIEIVRPALNLIDAHSEAAENLVLGTAVQESNLTYLRQHNMGPALGFFQMEPATHDDIWENFLAYRPDTGAALRGTMGETPRAERLIWDLRYAAAMCRVHYLRVPEPLPPSNAIASLGRYWKNHYNTALGRGRAEEFVEKYQTHVGRE